MTSRTAVLLLLLLLSFGFHSCRDRNESTSTCNSHQSANTVPVHSACYDAYIAVIVECASNQECGIFNARIPRGGKPPFRFKWSTGQLDSGVDTSSIPVTRVGWYSVTVTDKTGDSVVAKKWAGRNEPDETMKDAQGNFYYTVKIGKQVWMAENLKTNLEDSWCYGKKEENCATYGRLYNWYTALNACPTGWHLPSDDEWKQMESYLGVKTEELNEDGLRGSTEGGKLKSSSTLWDCPNQNASNASGFSALPGGPRYKLGMFGRLGHNATWWTSTEYDSVHAWFRYVGHSHAKIGRIDNEKIGGHSIRCVKDSI